MSPCTVVDEDFSSGCSLNSKAGLSRLRAQDCGAQLLSYIATHSFQATVNPSS